MKAILNFRDQYFRDLRVGWFLAVEQIKRSSKGTTGLIIFIMVLTFLNMVVVSGLLVGLIAGSFAQYRESYSGDVIITAAPGRSYIENSPDLVAFLDKHPKVKSFSPRLGVGAQILGTLNDNPEKNQRTNQISMRLVGINPERESATTDFSDSILYGENLSPGDSGKILLGATMIEKYSTYADANIPGFDFLKDVDVGSRVRVKITAGGSQPVSKGKIRKAGDEGDGQVIIKDFIVKGLVKSKVDEISTRAFILDDELKRMLPANKEQYAEIAIRTDPAYEVQLTRQIKSFMGNFLARVQTSDEAVPSFVRDIEKTMAVLGNALSSIALVVASITIFIVIYINAVTKKKYIGIMKGIGISPQAIQYSYVLQALFYGLSGSIIGLAITFGLLKPYFAANPINFPFSDGILVATWLGSIARVMILMLVTLAAGYLPAKIIIRRNTLDAILGR